MATNLRVRGCVKMRWLLLTVLVLLQATFVADTVHTQQYTSSANNTVSENGSLMNSSDHTDGRNDHLMFSLVDYFHADQNLLIGYLSDMGQLLWQCLEMKYVFFFSILVTMAVMLWRHHCQVTSLDEELRHFKHQLGSTKVTVNKLMPEIRDCRQVSYSNRRQTKRLESLYRAADADAEKIKSLGRELETWKSTWMAQVADLRQKIKSQHENTVMSSLDGVVKREDFEHFLLWNDSAIISTYNMLKYHKGLIDYLYADMKVGY